MSDITHRQVPTNGISLHVAEAGEGKPVILCHGFPESWYSWRHQLPALAGAGYRAVAPDQRGYGDSDRPSRVEDYGTDQLTADLVGLLDEMGEEKAIFVGHDWGALIVWEMALMHPERMEAVVGVSVPFIRWPTKPTDVFRGMAGDNFMYILYFQEVGPAEKELEEDPYATMAKVLWSASGDGVPDMPEPLPAEGTGFLTGMSDPPKKLPKWLTDEDIETYVRQFRTSGFFGPLSYYRNFDRNWERNKDLDVSRAAMPSFFIGGDKDGVIRNRAMIENMKGLLPDLRGVVLIEGAGHWTQQERPEEFNRALLGFLDDLKS